MISLAFVMFSLVMFQVLYQDIITQQHNQDCWKLLVKVMIETQQFLPYSFLIPGISHKWLSHTFLPWSTGLLVYRETCVRFALFLNEGIR